MNVIAWDRAYCLYPRATFEARLALYCQTVDERDLIVIDKYRARGWDIVHEWPALHPATARPLPISLIPLAPRWIGDRHAWSLPLSLTGITLPSAIGRSPPRTADPVLCSSWTVIPRRAPGLMGWWEGQVYRTPRGMRVDYKVVDADGFRHRYVVAPRESGTRIKSAMAILQELYLFGPTALHKDNDDLDEDEDMDPL